MAETITEGTLNGKKRKAVKLADKTLVFDANRDVEDILYNAYAEKLQVGKVSGKSWLDKFVNKNLDAIEANLSDDPDTALSALREINRVAYKTQDFFNKKKSMDVDFSKYLLRDCLSPWQKNVYDDFSKRKSILGGRRLGKSWLMVELALKHVLNGPIVVNGVSRKRTAAIIGLTLEKTATIYWDNIKAAIEHAHISTTRIDNGTYTVVLSNGNVLQLCGNNSKAEREKLRGLDLSFAGIDEMQSQQGLYYLMNSIIGPMIKGTDGDIVCAGTAPLTANTQWERIILDRDNWSFHHGNMMDNPFIPNHENALEEVLRENNWTRDNIIFRREYLAEIAYDTNRMIYPIRKYYDSIEAGYTPRRCVIGVDYGWADYSSFAPILSDDDGKMYLVDEFKQNKISSTDLVNKAHEIVEKIHTEWNIEYENIVFVADSSHQQISADMCNRGMNVINAYKQDEAYQIAQVNEALNLGDLLIKKEGYFDLECNELSWQVNEEKNTVIYRIDDDLFHPDIADSVKYALTYIRSQAYMG